MSRKDDIEPSTYIDHTCHNTPGNFISGKYVIKISRYDYGTPEKWIIFVALVKKALTGQNITTDPPIYKCIERAHTKFIQQAKLAGSCTVGNYTMVMA